MQPAVPDGLRGGVRPVPIAQHYLRAAEGELADLAGRQHGLAILDRDYLTDGARHRQTDRARLAAGRRRIDAGDGRGFGETVAFDDAPAGTPLEILAHFHWQWCAAGDDHLDRA